MAGRGVLRELAMQRPRQAAKGEPADEPPARREEGARGMFTAHSCSNASGWKNPSEMDTKVI